MNGSAARIYAALALRAAGRAVDAGALRKMEALLGLPDDPEVSEALLQLLAHVCGDAGHEVVDVARREQPAGTAATSLVSAPAAPSRVGAPAGGEDLQALWDAPSGPPPSLDDAWYVYGVVQGPIGDLQDATGLEGMVVEEARFEDLAAIGHPCPASPYVSDSEEIVIGWVKAHDSVLKQALQLYEAVVPCKFNTLIQADGCAPAEAVRAWLERNQDDLRQRMAKVHGCHEYGVRVIWDPKAAREQIRMEHAAKSYADQDDVPSGLRYLQQEQERRMFADAYRDRRAALRARAMAYIGALVMDVVEEHREASTETEATILRCACLVAKAETPTFNRALERLQETEGVSVQVSGPWPAYNFVAQVGGDDR